MDHYDYHSNLLPERFEDFAIDVTQKRENTVFEVFAKEKDKGIDARGQKDNQTIIMQAKRYGDYKDLKKSLKKEAEKIESLNPDRYILITTIKMTVKRKEEIKSYFKKYIKDDTDIIGKEDIDNFINAPENISILEKYNELWMSNTHVLERILERTLERGINEESKFNLEKIIKKEKTYSENQYFYEALEILKQKHYILIYGNAGAGKSTLAGHLCYYFLREMEDAEFIYTDTLENLKKVYKTKKNQIFFLDDFWGSWRKNKNGSEIDTRQLMRIIEMIEQDNSKILVITSREYIFRQFEEENYIERMTFKNASIIMNIEEYTSLEKVKILFKQLENTKFYWHDIYEITQNYKEYVDNPNYNPRILEMAINQIENEEEHKYESIHEELYMALEEPEEFLRGIFHGQKEGAQIITFLLLLFSGKMKLKTLEVMFCDYIDEDGKTSNAKKECFKDYIKQLENTIIEEYREEDESVIIVFKNATIEESIQEQFNSNVYAYSKNIIKITNYINPLLCLCDIWDDKEYEIYREKITLGEELKEQIVEKIINQYEKLKWHETENLYEDPVDELPKKDIEKLIKIIKISPKLNSQKFNDFIKNKVNDIWKSLKNNKLGYYEKSYFSELLKQLNKSKIGISIEPKEILGDFYKKINFASEYVTLNEIGKIYPREYKSFMKKYETTIRENIKNQIEKDDKYFEEHECYMEQNYLHDETVRELQEIYGNKTKKEEQKKIKNEYLKRNNNEEDDGCVQDEIEKLLGLEFSQIIERVCVKYIRSLEITKEEKDMLIESSKKWYISPFFRAKESIDGIIEFLLNEKQIPIKDFTATLLAYRIKKAGLKPYMIGKISAIAFDTLFTGDLLLRKEQIYDYEITEEELEILVKNKILFYTGNWVRFENLQVLSYLCLLVIDIKGEELEEAICALITLCDRSGYNISNTIFKLCEETNKEKFEEELIFPSVKYFVSRIDKKNEIEIAKSIIKELFIEIHKYKKIQYITTIGLSIDIPVMGLDETIVAYKAKEYIRKLEKINIKNLKKYKDEDEIKLYKHLDDENFIKILEEIGVIDILNEAYKELEQFIEN